MRRRCGATHVALDTCESWVRYTVGSPRILDWKEMARAAYGAGYTVIGIDVEAEGTLEEGTCADCKKSVRSLVLPGTGQRIEVRGLEGAATRARVTGTMQEWNEGHPFLVVKKPEESP